MTQTKLLLAFLNQQIDRDIEQTKLLGLEAWLPTAEETKEFYSCHCGDPQWPVCYSPAHRYNLKIEDE